MDLSNFLHQLQFDPEKVKPLDWEVNWEDAPLPYKLYRHLPAFPLPADVPLILESRETPSSPKLREISHFLWYVFGLTQLSESVIVSDRLEDRMSPLQTYRRFVPSGGGLYPNELYMYLQIEDLPVGIYHYDAAHHRLIMLREGNFDSYLGKALGNRCDLQACFGIVFVSTMFWKNFFKYNNFSYRLQGLDAGVVIGQLLEVAKRFGYESGVYFQFLDQALNHLLGLSEQEESVYAVIPLTVDPGMNWFTYSKDYAGNITASELCLEQEVVRHEHYIRSRVVVEFPMLLKMNEASMQNNIHLFRPIEKENGVTRNVNTQALPMVNRLSYDFTSVCQKRFSPEMNFVWSQVSQVELAKLLQEATLSYSYRNDLDGTQENPVSRVSLYGCFFGIEGINDGAYRYQDATHSLEQMRPGDHRSWLQYGMSVDNLNLFQVPLCFHVAANKSNLQLQLGYRGYRIQQMEAGMLVQRLVLAACAMGMGGHPLLGFDANTIDEIYGIASQGKTSLIQIPVGSYRGRSRLEGSLSH